MVDVSKIKVGDEVTVRAKVHESSAIDGGGLWVVAASVLDAPNRARFVANDILSHTPAPKEWKVGDKCRVCDRGDWEIAAPPRARGNGTIEVALWRHGAGYSFSRIDYLEPVE